MILVNLLPHREERRKRRKAAFFAGLGVAAAAGLGIVALWFLVVQQLTSVQQDRNAFLTMEIKKLEAEIKDVASLRAEIDSLKARQKAVEDLQVDRNVPVHLLNELVRLTPEGIYFSSMKQQGDSVVVTGIAQTNERVSEFLRNTSNDSEWLVRPELVEIKAAAVQAAAARLDQRRLFDFSVRLSVKRPVAEPATPPGRPAGAAAAKSV